MAKLPKGLRASYPEPHAALPRLAYARAIADFDAARRRALISDLLRPLLGRPTELLPFDEVKERLRLRSLVDRGLREVPLDRIVGSLGRQREFTRAFLPREESLRQRWEDVEELAEGLRGFPPVELYQVGEAYFVVDGHHRVSVAHRLGSPAIEARVQEFLTPVPLGKDDSIEQVLLKQGLADFLEATHFAPSGADDFVTTVPQGYDRLLEHIGGHRYFRGIEAQGEISWREAAESWRDRVYRPMVETIRDSGILADFPGRTPTDLYLFVMDHLATLRESYGDHATPSRALHHFELAHRQATGWRRRLRRAWAYLTGR